MSWREVLGLLVALAACYGVIAYAVINAPQEDREAASEKDQKGSRVGVTVPRTSPEEATNGETKTVTVRVTGSSGEPFGANVGNLTSSRTVEGYVPNDYEVRVSTDPRSGDYVAATVWKTTGDSKELKVQVVDGGKVVQENSTTKDYGATGVRWSPGQQPSGGTQGGSTTPDAEKTGGAG